MSDATIYNWLKQEKVDRGEIAGLSTDQALELAAGVNAKALQAFMGTPTFRSRWIATAT